MTRNTRFNPGRINVQQAIIDGLAIENGRTPQVPDAEPERTPVPAELAAQEPRATEKQTSYLRSLLDERELDGERRRSAIRLLDADGFSKKQASKSIEYLLTLPKLSVSLSPTSAPVPETQAPFVPAGRYAVDGEDGATKFYRVDRPTEGRWAGYVFVKVQASDDLHNIKGRAAKAAILAKIAVDPRAASIRYGHELGHCGICGKTLTNPDSIERGIGPICAENTGW